MIIYNVTTKIERAAAEEWGAWLRDEHIPAVMATGLFSGYRLLRILEDSDDGDDGLTYAVQYECASAAQFDHYLKTHAADLQRAARERFPDRFVAIRTLMQVIESQTVFARS